MHRLTLQKSIAAILVLTILAPSLAFLSPRTAHAIPVVVVSGAGTLPSIGTLATTGASALADGLLSTKELILDPIFFALGRILIQEITADIVNWINSGFNGNPAFVTNQGDFFLDAFNEVTGAFIEELGLTSLCSPFGASVRAAIARPTTFQQRASCTLNDVVANIDAFYGDFRQGGWTAWVSLTTEPQNNPYGAYLIASEELARRRGTLPTETEKKKNEFISGRGFLSWTECRAAPSEEGLGPEEVCETVTPGSVIENQLANQLGSGVRQLEVADEVDEIIAALMSQLVSAVFQGGLKSLSSGSNGAPSYTEQLRVAENTDALLSISESLINDLERDIDTAEGYRDAKQGGLNRVESSEALLNGLISCYEGKTGLSASNKQEAENRIATASSTIASDITPIKKTLEEDAAKANATIAELDALRLRTISAVTIETLSAISAEYMFLIESESIISVVDEVNAQAEENEITDNMNTLNSQTNAQLNECAAFPPLLF